MIYINRPRTVCLVPAFGFEALHAHCVDIAAAVARTTAVAAGALPSYLCRWLWPAVIIQRTEHTFRTLFGTDVPFEFRCVGRRVIDEITVEVRTEITVLSGVHDHFMPHFIHDLRGRAGLL